MQNREKITPIKILTSYYNILSHNIDSFGYVTEFLNQSDNFLQTRLLCQTRSMYFLLEYSSLFNNAKALKQACTLYELIKTQYYCHEDGWLQFPKHENLQSLYEYSFLLFSISKLYSIVKKDVYKSELYSIHSIIQKKFYYPNSKFSNLEEPNGLISQNALMHLYEAYLELYKVIPELEYKDILEELLSSIKEMFYDSEKELISEYTFIPTSEQNIYEPGHSFEWCCLLNETSRLNINIHLLPIEHNMILSAEKKGVSNQNIVLPVIPNKSTVNRYRIWPMLERIRYYAMTKNKTKLENIFNTFVRVFILKDSCLPIEYIKQDLSPDFDKIKTTTSYHLINSIKHLI